MCLSAAVSRDEEREEKPYRNDRVSLIFDMFRF